MTHIEIKEHKFYLVVRGYPNQYDSFDVDGEILDAKIRSMDAESVIVMFVVDTDAEKVP